MKAQAVEESAHRAPSSLTGLNQERLHASAAAAVLAEAAVVAREFPPARQVAARAKALLRVALAAPEWEEAVWDPQACRQAAPNRALPVFAEADGPEWIWSD